MKVFSDVFDFLKNNEWVVRLVSSIVVIIAAIVIYFIIDKFINRKLKEGPKVVNDKKYATFFKMIKSISKYVLIIISVFVILQINGVNVSSMLASVGVIGIVIAFAVKDSLQDIIRGFDIMTDNYYQVGDVIKYDTNIGKVTAIGLKTTKIEDINSMNVVSISNRKIQKVEKESHMINIDIPLPYELKLSEAEKIIDKMIDEIKKNKKVENVEYRGVNKLDESSVNYHIKVYSSPAIKPQIRRDSLTTIIRVMEENKISVPYRQIDVHNK